MTDNDQQSPMAEMFNGILDAVDAVRLPQHGAATIPKNDQVTVPPFEISASEKARISGAGGKRRHLRLV